MQKKKTLDEDRIFNPGFWYYFKQQRLVGDSKSSISID